MPEDSVDAVVIGAGPNRLVAANLLADHGLRLRHAPDVLAHVLSDDRCVILSRDLDRTATSVAAFVPGDAWRAEFDFWDSIRDDLIDALFTPFPPILAGGKPCGTAAPSTAPGANAARAAFARNGVTGGVYRTLITQAHRTLYR